MVTDGLLQLHFDPLATLLASENQALIYFVNRDLCGHHVGPPDYLWQLPEAQRILKKQLANGSWPRSGESKHPAINYALIETWRHFRFLMDQYGFTRQHPAAERAAEFLFSCQTRAGDFRGFLANQYATYYTGAILALLIRAGYADDPRVERGMAWLLDMRQDDQGWTVPLITHKLDRVTQYRLTSEMAQPLKPDRSKPFSHNWTGMVLRAFAAHPVYRSSSGALTAARLLKSRFFQPDVYSSYQSADYWVRFEYPFWWNNLVAALDSLSLIGPEWGQDPDIQRALKWLVDHQEVTGLWKLNYARPQAERDTQKNRDMKLWVSLAICRVFERFHQNEIQNNPGHII